MKKTITILGCLGLAVFLSSFLISFTAKKMRQTSAVESTAARQTDAPGTSTENPVVFYNAVGGSPKSEQTSTAKQSSRFTIEIANFNNQSEAEALLLRLKNKGIEGFYTPVRRGGQVIYRVRLGMFANQDDANKILAKVNHSANVRGVISKLQ